MSIASVAAKVLEQALKHPEIISAVGDLIDGGMSADDVAELVKRSVTAAVRERLARDLA